ncbi:MAG TPA: CmcI family methyltransferase [Chthoniobacter sp.]|nr:CmcI family methyltransferase [Chthoniobacter sp.]
MDSLNDERREDDSPERADPTALDSKNFVRHSYRSLLGREPSAEELDHRAGFAAMLDTKEWTREQVMWALIQSEEFAARHSQKEFVPAGHFYSAVPSQADRIRAMSANPTPAPLSLDLAPCDQARLLRSFLPYRDDCPFPDEATPPFRYHFNNDTFAWTDGFMLHAMMRRFRPQRIIEIGSGNTSALMLDVRGLFLGGNLELTFIEPHAALVRSLMKPGDAEQTKLIERQVQDVDPAVFQSLQANDILFVDSTHVSKAGSDVNYIFFEILPRLNPGVIIHFHDIFHPFEYPREWIREGRAWNELYLLRAFLMHNSDYRVLLGNSYVHQRFPGWMARHYPRLHRNAGGSLWLQKVADRHPRFTTHQQENPRENRPQPSATANEKERAIIDRFHNLYYHGPQGDGPIFFKTRWRNVECLKCPLDLWMYQEIITEYRPELIVETGTHQGGSTLFLADMLDLVGKGEIISIDIATAADRPQHPRIRYVTGSSSDPELVHSLLGGRPSEKRMIILDSDHSRKHVLAELELFAPYLSAGDWLIVEDTNVNGHPTCKDFGEGPFEAVAEFMERRNDFVCDRSKEKFLLTFNPGGFLRKIR